MRRAAAGLGALVAAALLAGCQLTEVTLTQPERVVVAEAYVRVNLTPALGSQPAPDVSVFLHETLGTTGGSGTVPGAAITVVRPADGLTIPLQEVGIPSCVIALPEHQSGTCYVPRAGAPVASIAPGDRLTLRIELAGGGTMLSETTLPGAFRFFGWNDLAQCALDPLTASGLQWSRSAGAWAYVSDTFIKGIAAQFPAEKKIEDPLYLWGLSVSAQDTTIVFPREFGLFSRADLDHDVSALLQQGLPTLSSATVSVAAVDRNWVGWGRGANFNPSGVVRVPSVSGAGTGVFAAAVVRNFRVVSSDQSKSGPPCAPPPKR